MKVKKKMKRKITKMINEVLLNEVDSIASVVWHKIT